ncbi:MAG TPA: SGNH hydrolase domain-containing protein [Acidimicrobiales bacterium]|nr:SGNH hydrolase domain-containing protein [Acidimicrobiales bacterium]
MTGPAAVAGGAAGPKAPGPEQAATLGAPSGLSSTERGQLAALDAYSTHPLRFLLLGDSISLTLGQGLSLDSVKHFGVSVIDRAKLGCDLDPTLPVMISGKPGPATPGCPTWTLAWHQLVARYRPAVVGLLLGRWEAVDHLFGGQWVHVGEPAWDAHLVAELDQAIDVLSSTGAKVILFTMPYVDPVLPPGQTVPFPENDPARADAYNADVKAAARLRPKTATVVDLNALLDPHGKFATTVDGVVVRWSDRIHISIAGGELVQPVVLSTVVRLSLPRALRLRALASPS